jgi:hypothetical protein
MEKNNNEVAIANETVEHANKRLAEITAEGFPFSFEEVKMTVRTDSAGIYIYSGATPVCAVYRKGADVIRQIKEAIWTTVDATKVAVERRAGLKAEADAMANEAEQRERAKNALLAAGLSTDMLDDGINADAAKAVVAVAEKAVKTANQGLFLLTGGYLSVKDAKMRVEAYSGGVVVTAGGKPCLVTRFPKLFNSKGIERMTAFMTSEISALNESRRRYFAEINEISAKVDEISAQAWHGEKVAAVM